MTPEIEVADRAFRENTTAALARIEAHIEPLSGLPDRVAKLESWRNRILGVLTAISGAVLWIGQKHLPSLVALFS